MRPAELPRGQTLPASAEVVLCPASANHDERQFASPDSLVLRRKPNPHVSFGLRARICIGRSLARLESLVALSQIARAFSGLQLTGRAVFTANARFRREVTGSITGATAAAHRGHQAPELR